MAKGKEKLCLIVYKEEMGTEDVINDIYRNKKEVIDKIGALAEKKIGDILVVFRNLSGAVFNPRTIVTNYYYKSSTAAGPSRTSVIFHPMYMQDRALEDYLKTCMQENYLPVILADVTTVEERVLTMDTYTVKRKTPGLRNCARKLASDEKIEFVEHKIDDLLKAQKV